jgi:hypothetical protein
VLQSGAVLVERGTDLRQALLAEWQAISMPNEVAAE